MDRIRAETKGRVTRGIVLCAILVVSYSFLGMPLTSFSSYYTKFYPSPENLIFIRYLFSITLRLILLISGIGILFRTNIFRKIIIFISFFTIATLYWKHPVICLKRVLFWKITQGVLPVDIIPKINMLAWFSVIVLYIIDISVCLCLIYYLTRLKVKEWFK